MKGFPRLQPSEEKADKQRHDDGDIKHDRQVEARCSNLATYSIVGVSGQLVRMTPEQIKRFERERKDRDAESSKKEHTYTAEFEFHSEINESRLLGRNELSGGGIAGSTAGKSSACVSNGEARPVSGRSDSDNCMRANGLRKPSNERSPAAVGALRDVLRITETDEKEDV